MRGFTGMMMVVMCMCLISCMVSSAMGMGSLGSLFGGLGGLAGGGGGGLKKVTGSEKRGIVCGLAKVRLDKNPSDATALRLIKENNCVYPK